MDARVERGHDARCGMTTERLSPRVLDARWSLSSGRPKAGPVGGHEPKFAAGFFGQAFRGTVELLAQRVR
jgi:hypothetical protein